MNENGGMGWLLIVIVDHSLIPSKNTWAMNKIPWLIGYELGTYTYTTLLGILRRQKVGKPWETWKIEDLQ